MSATPQLGREQEGHHPYFVISRRKYNKLSRLALMCPIRSRSFGNSFEVKIPNGMRIEGVILSDQVRNLDWEARKSEFVCRLPSGIIEEVISKISTLLE
jgi:mRNA interferase MazF